jgi:DNA-binding GntR family transcriptional regulator
LRKGGRLFLRSELPGLKENKEDGALRCYSNKLRWRYMTKKKSPVSGRKRVSKKVKKEEELPVDVAFRKIKEMMYHHEIVPGQKLLYQELAKKLGMSITPIIQALNRLQLLNIVYSERNKGYYVGETDPVEASELFTAREAFETFLVPAIIKNLTDKNISDLEKALKEHVKAASIPEYRRILMIKDTNFHLQMIKIAGIRSYTTCPR